MLNNLSTNELAFALGALSIAGPLFIALIVEDKLRDSAGLVGFVVSTALTMLVAIVLCGVLCGG